METRICSDGLVHFRGFRFDLETHELSRKGCEIAIRGHPAQVLALLLENPGKVVSRTALRKSLWPDHTFVDFEHILNNSINHLREALGDDADSPRFIQTVPGIGYRFIAHLEGPRPRTPASLPSSAAESCRDVRQNLRGQTHESKTDRPIFLRLTRLCKWFDAFFATVKPTPSPLRRKPKPIRK